jgi:urease accessory protein
MLTLNKIYTSNNHPIINCQLPLTAEQRMRSHQRIKLETGEIVLLKLPRGTTLEVGDILQSEKNDLWVQIEAKPETVLTVRANSRLELLKGAYHLGNRHIPLEITEDYLRLNDDRVLEKMLIQLGLNVTREISPFYPETGAYHHHHD